MLTRTTGKVGMGLFCAVLLAAAGAHAATLDITLEADRVASGTYDIRIYGQVDTASGLYGLPITLQTLDSVGVTEPVKAPGPPKPPFKVLTAWALDSQQFGFLQPPIKQDQDADGDDDAAEMAFADVQGSWGNLALGMGSPALLGTQTWTMNEAQKVFITAEVGNARWYAGATAEDEATWTNAFDTITINGQPNGVGGLEVGPTDDGPTADAGGGPDGYGEEDWPMTPHGWNNPARTIALDGTGSTGTIDTYDWLIAPPAAAGGDFMSLAVSGPTPEVSILAIADALGIAVEDLPGPYGTGDPDPDVYEYRLMLTVTGDGASNSDETTLFVPEPGTLALLSLGGLVALIRRRRRS